MRTALCRTLPLVALVAFAGCEYEITTPPLTPPEVREVPDTVGVNGVTFDPEYYLLSFLLCGDPENCPPPILMEGIPHVEAGKIASAQVSTLVPGEAGPGIGMPMLTGYDGTFSITGIPHPTERVLYLNAYVPDGAEPPPFGEPFPRVWHPGMVDAAPVLDYPYLPTTTVRPIFTEPRACFNQRAVLLGDIGILQAVALWQTFTSTTGTTTTVSDLLDDTKTGGVLVWWNLIPEDVVLRVPGFGTMTDSDVGETFLVSWAPPGVIAGSGGPPIQADMGFFVDGDNDPMNSWGLTVTVLPPTVEPYTAVQLTPYDPVEDPVDGRPWPFLPLEPIRVRAGEVSYGEMQPGIPMVQGRPVPAETCFTPGMSFPPE